MRDRAGVLRGLCAAYGCGCSAYAPGTEPPSHRCSECSHGPCQHAQLQLGACRAASCACADFKEVGGVEDECYSCMHSLNDHCRPHASAAAGQMPHAAGGDAPLVVHVLSHPVNPATAVMIRRQYASSSSGGEEESRRRSPRLPTRSAQPRPRATGNTSATRSNSANRLEKTPVTSPQLAAEATSARHTSELSACSARQDAPSGYGSAAVSSSGQHARLVSDLERIRPFADPVATTTVHNSHGGRDGSASDAPVTSSWRDPEPTEPTRRPAELRPELPNMVVVLPEDHDAATMGTGGAEAQSERLSTSPTAPSRIRNGRFDVAGGDDNDDDQLFGHERYAEEEEEIVITLNSEQLESSFNSTVTAATPPDNSKKTESELLLTKSSALDLGKSKSQAATLSASSESNYHSRRTLPHKRLTALNEASRGSKNAAESATSQWRVAAKTPGNVTARTPSKRASKQPGPPPDAAIGSGAKLSARSSVSTPVDRLRSARLQSNIAATKPKSTSRNAVRLSQVATASSSSRTNRTRSISTSSSGGGSIDSSNRTDMTRSSSNRTNMTRSSTNRTNRTRNTSSSSDSSSGGGSSRTYRTRNSASSRRASKSSVMSPAPSYPRSTCGNCPGCRVQDDCGKCNFCKDKPKFGGAGRWHKKCRRRICEQSAQGKALRGAK